MVALHVVDDEKYSAYRAAIAPLLEQHGGGFRFDFAVAKTLRAEADHPITRVFAIYFRDEAAKDAFFSHPEYLAIREKYFTPSVKARTLIAQYSR